VLAKGEMPPEPAPAALLFPDPLPTLGEAEAALIAETLRRAEAIRAWPPGCWTSHGRP
jgi:hypothetical protein